VTVSWHWHGYYEWLVTSHLVLVYSLTSWITSWHQRCKQRPRRQCEN